MNPAQQIEKWIKDAKLKRDADKKQKSSSNYNKLEASPEEISVFADELAKQNGTTPEEEASKIQAAIDRDNAIEEATFAQNHPVMNMVSEGGLVTGGGIPQANPVIPQAKTVSAAATPENKVNEEMAKANEKQNIIDDNVAEEKPEVESVTENVTEESKPDAEKNYYNKAAMSIWDAYRNGLIDKNAATYFTIDALAKAAKNMGRSIGNVGAQFTGGAIDNNTDESDWSKRKDEILAEEIKKEKEGVGSAASRQAESEKLDIEAKKIRNAYTPAQLENQIEMFKKELEMADINLDMAHSKTDLINFIKKDPNYAKSPFKMGLVSYLTQSGTAGATQAASRTLSDALNWILTIAK